MVLSYLQKALFGPFKGVFERDGISLSGGKRAYTARKPNTLTRLLDYQWPMGCPDFG
jgi:hypothetical protein